MHMLCQGGSAFVQAIHGAGVLQEQFPCNRNQLVGVARCKYVFLGLQIIKHHKWAWLTKSQSYRMSEKFHKRATR